MAENKSLKFELVYLGLSEGISKQGNNFTVAKFFDTDTKDCYDFFVGDAKLKAVLEGVKSLSVVTAVLKLDSWQGQARLSLVGVAA